MRKFIPHIISVCLAAALLILSAGAVLSQSDEGPNTACVSGASEDDATYVSGITSARARSLVGVALGLLSLIIGWRAKVHSAATPKSIRPWSMAALVLGLVATIFSVMHLAGNTGGFGTGGGKAGAIVSLVLGISGTSLSGLALRPHMK